jgi:diacylglycerol kinase family enzyme
MGILLRLPPSRPWNLCRDETGISLGSGTSGKGAVKYLLVFNRRAKRYSVRTEADIVAQAATILRHGTVAVTYTVPNAQDPTKGYDIENFAYHSGNVDCVIAVGGDGTVNVVVSALMRHGLAPRIPLGVIPYGTGNNLIRSYGLERESGAALQTIRQDHKVRLDIGTINQQNYFINTSFGLFAYLVRRRVTKSLVGWVYDALRHIRFRPWASCLRYTDGEGRVNELPREHYIVGALLNTSHYGSVLHMAPDVVGCDGLFDVKLIRAVPVTAYPLVFRIILTGRYQLSNRTLTFRARQIEVMPESACHFEADGDLIPPQQTYQISMAGYIQLIVPPASAK